MSELYTVKGNTARFTLHKGQAQAWRSTARFTFAIAGTQGGKTSFVPLWLDREIGSCGPGDYLAVTSSYDLFKLKFLPEMRRYFISIKGWSEDKSDRVLWRKDGAQITRIILRSAQSEGGLESSTVKAAVLDECGQSDFRVESWEAVLRRLSLSQGRVLGTTTPYNFGWLKTEIYDRWRAGDKDYAVIQFRSLDNPAFPREEYDRAKRTLPAWKFEMFYNGNFTRPAGMIYGDFSDTENLCKRFEISANWPRRVGVDFGGVHTATVWSAENPQTHIHYLYREILEGNKTTKEHAKEWLSFGEHVVNWSGGAPSEDQNRRDFSVEGVRINRPPISDVEPGIDRVIDLIKTRRLVVFDDMKGLRDEIGTYARVLDATGQPTDKIKDKETFHRLDALRYLASVISSGGVSIGGKAKVGNYIQ
jgi:hypothetical protein